MVGALSATVKRRPAAMPRDVAFTRKLVSAFLHFVHRDYAGEEPI